MPHEIPSLCFSLSTIETPPPLQRTRQIEHPGNGEWHADSEEMEEHVYRLVNVALEAGQLWQFTSTTSRRQAVGRIGYRLTRTEESLPYWAGGSLARAGLTPLCRQEAR